MFLLDPNFSTKKSRAICSLIWLATKQLRMNPATRTAHTLHIQVLFDGFRKLICHYVEQCDGGSENINRAVWCLCALLVEKGESVKL